MVNLFNTPQMNQKDNPLEDQRLKAKLQEMATHIYAIWGICDVQSRSTTGRTGSTRNSSAIAAGSIKPNFFRKLLTALFK